MMRQEKVVGVIGGMGPQATVDFMRRLVEAVPAVEDSDHLHVIADNNAKVPSRIRALVEGGGEDPAPVLIEMARKLERAGAQLLVIPCNTAHYYVPAITSAVTVPVLDMITASIERLNLMSPRPRKIGILASKAVRLVGFLERRLQSAGFESIFPAVDDEGELMEAIRSVKSGSIGPAEAEILGAVANRLEESGAEALLVACTELSLLPAPRTSLPLLDTLDVLVEATVRVARG